jgi:hypothetical protein
MIELVRLTRLIGWKSFQILGLICPIYLSFQKRHIKIIPSIVSLRLRLGPAPQKWLLVRQNRRNGLRQTQSNQQHEDP